MLQMTVGLGSTMPTDGASGFLCPTLAGRPLPKARLLGGGVSHPHTGEVDDQHPTLEWSTERINTLSWFNIFRNGLLQRMIRAAHHV